MAAATHTKYSKRDKVPINQGLTTVYNPDKLSKNEIPVDIIAVPGLGASPEWTWKDKSKVDWLRDPSMLPHAVPNARVMVFEYESQWFGKGSVDQTITNVATELVRAVFNERLRGQSRPIVFVAHSLGGLIVEKALVTAKLHQRDYPRIFTSVVGCIFLGTPFRGTKTQAKASVLAEMLQGFGLGTNSGLIKLLEEGSEPLRELLNDFVALAKEANLRVFCFWELHKSDLIRLLHKKSPIQHLEMVVDRNSATFDGCNEGALAADHFTLNKFTGPKDGRYVQVSGEISKTVQSANRILKSRHNDSRQALIDDGKYQEALELLGVTDPRKDMEASRKMQSTSQYSWVLSNEIYKRWKENDASKVLWIHGGAGKGQAVIASTIIEELTLELKPNEGTYLAYFFCDGKNPHQRYTIDILKLLIRQIISRSSDLTEHLLVDQRKEKKGGHGSQNFDVNSVSALWNSLQNILQNYAVKTVYFVVNALNETDAESRKEFFSLLSPYLKAQQDDDNNSDESCIKWVLLTGSPRPDIETSLRNALVIDLDNKEDVGDHLDAAVKAHISAQVDELAKKKNYGAALAYFVKRQIHSRCEKNLIYVNLVIQELKNLSTPRSSHDIRRFLEGLPYGLTDIFEHIRRRVLDPQNEGIEHTKEIFRALILSCRSPTIYELALMADLPLEHRNEETTLKAYVAACGGFVTISEVDDETVEWIDDSAKEHLEAYAKDQLKLTPDDVQHGITALRCLDYVRSTNVVQEAEQHETISAQCQEDSARGSQPDTDEDKLDYGDSERAGEVPFETEGNEDQTGAQAYPSPPQDSSYKPYSYFCQSSSAQDYKIQSVPVQDDSNQGYRVENHQTQEYQAYRPQSNQAQEVHNQIEQDLEKTANGREAQNSMTEQQNDHEQKDLDQEETTGEVRTPEVNSTASNTAPSEAAQDPGMWLDYPGKYWLDHAKEAPVDIVEEFDMDDDFWREDSSSRDAWWEHYAKDSDFDGLTSVTPLHIAAISGFSALVDHLLKRGRVEDLQKADSWGCRPFYWACSEGDIYVVQRLLQAGAEVNARSLELNVSALWIAASHGHAEIVGYLLDHHAEIDVQDHHRGTPFYAAVESGHTSIVRQLIERGANINLTGGLHCRPLNAAAYRGDIELVRLLLQKGAEVDPDEPYRYGSALGAAARKGHNDIVRLLLQKGWNANRKAGSYGSALVAAATYGHTKVVQALLEKDPDVTTQELALEIAAKNGKAEVVQKLLEQPQPLRHPKAFLRAASYGHDDILQVLHKYPIDQDTLDTALYEASDHEHESTVGLLLEFGASPDAEGEEYGTALTAAAYDGSDGIVQILLENGANVNKQGGSYGNALQAAADEGSVDIVQRLLEHGAHVNTEAIGKYGSALQAACYSGKQDVVELLLKYGADVNANGGQCGFPIIAAADDQNESIVEILIKHGADVNVKGAEDNTPVLVLAGLGLPKETIELLLDHNAEIEATDDQGNTALIATAYAGDDEGLQLLLDRGANIQACGEQFGTSLHAAASEGDEDCCAVLLKNGADVNMQGGPWGTALQAAAWAKDLDTIKVLLDAGADVNLGGGDYGSALQAAAYAGDLECLQATIKAGADVHQEGGMYGCALQAAASEGHLECLQAFLDEGADVNQRCGKYLSALQAAASKNGNDSCVELLLKHDADVSLLGGHYGSVVQAAAVGENLSMWDMLLAKGSDVHAVGGKYGTALQAAALKAEDEFVQRLLQHSANVNGVEGKGKYATPLQAAAYADRPEIVTILLKHGADVRINGGFYGNALNAAACRGNMQVVSILLNQSLPNKMLDEALLRAIHHRQEAVVDKLLKNGASVLARDEELGSAIEALQKELPVEDNSDDGGEQYEDSDDEYDEDDSDSDDEEVEGVEDEDDTWTGTAADDQDDNASVVSLQLESPDTDGKIKKLLEEALAKVKRNPSVQRYRTVRRKHAPAALSSPNNGRTPGPWDGNHAQYPFASQVAQPTRGGYQPYNSVPLHANNPYYQQPPRLPASLSPAISPYQPSANPVYVPSTSNINQYPNAGQVPETRPTNSHYRAYSGGHQGPQTPPKPYSYQRPNMGHAQTSPPAETKPWHSLSNLKKYLKPEQTLGARSASGDDQLYSIGGQVPLAPPNPYVYPPPQSRQYHGA